jgi:membrane-associated phospholipid phosphatase
MIIPFGKKNREAIFFRHWKLVLSVSAVAILLSYFLLDIPFAESFKPLPTSWKRGLKFFTNIIDPQYNNYLWPLLFFLFRYLLKKQVWANRFLLVVVSIPVGNVFVWILKFLFGRARPKLFFSEELYGFYFFKTGFLLESFPSGHAACVGAICGAFSCLYPRFSPLLLIGGFLLAMTRVALNLHFFADIIAGFTIGLLAAQWIYTVMKEQKTQF